MNNNISKLRIIKDITQQQLADALQIPRSTLAHYESGRNEMNYDLLCRMADFFGVSVDYILCREEYAIFEDARLEQPEIFKLYFKLSDSERKNLLDYARGMIAIRN